MDDISIPNVLPSHHNNPPGDFLSIATSLTNHPYTIFDHAPFTLALLIGKDLVIEYINNKNLEIWQKKREEVIGRPLFEVMPGLRASVEHIHRDVYKTGKRFEEQEIPIVLHLNGKDQLLFFNATIDPIFDQQGSMIGQIATSTDVTEQVAARKKLEESEKHLELLKDTVPALIFYLNRQQRYESANQAFQDWFGIPKERIIGMSVRELVGVKAWEKIQPYLQKAFEGETVQFQSEMNFRHGGKRWINAIYTPHRNEKGEVIGLMVIVDDITRQKTTEETISKNQRYLTGLKQQLDLSINAGHIGTWNWDAKEDHLNWSDEQKRLYGLDENADISRSADFFEFIVPEDREKVKLLWMYPTGKNEHQYEFRIQTKQGRVRWILNRSRQILDDSGSLIAITGVNIDITDQKERDEKIRQSERQMHLITDAIPMLIAYIDKDRKYRFNNKAYEHWFGFKREEIAGRHMLEVLGEKAYENLRKQIDRVLTGEPVHFETWAAYREGGERYISADYIPHFGKDNEVIGFFVVVNDATQQKKNEEQLEFAAAFSASIGDAVIGTAVAEGDFRILSWNKGAEKLYGWKAEEVLGKPVREIIRSEASPEQRQEWMEALNTIGFWQGETVQHNKAGSRLDISASVAVVKDKSGVVTGYVAVNRDISAIKQAQESLLALNRELSLTTDLLSRERERLGIALQTGALGAYEFQLKENTVWWSPETYQVYGVSPDTFTPSVESFRHLVHEDDWDLLWQKTAESIAQRVKFEHEYRIWLPDGTMRWVSNFSNVVADENGDVVRIIGMSTDITERKKQEEKLRIAATFIENISDAVIATDTAENDFRVLSWNKGAEVTYGWRADEVMGKPVRDFVRTEGGDSFLLEWTTALEKQGYWHGEVRQQHKLGHWIDTHVSIAPVTDSHGTVIGNVAVNRDITYRIQAAEKIKQSEEKYRRLSETLEEQVERRTMELVELNKKLELKNIDLENSREFLQQLINSSVELISVHDKDLRFIMVNDKYESSKGLRSEELAGKSILEITPTIKDTVQLESMKRALAGETVYLDKRPSLRLPDIYIDTYFIPLRIRDQIEGVIVMSRDVTAIARSEQELTQMNRDIVALNDMLKFAEKISNIGHFEVDPESGKIKWSDNLYSIYGLSKDTTPSFETELSCIHEEDREKMAALFKDSLALKQPHNAQYRFVKPDGTIIHISRSERIINNWKGRPYLVGTVQDITDLLTVVKELEEVKLADKLKSDFIQIASHELKTPITSIKGNVYLISQLLQEEKNNLLGTPGKLLKTSFQSIDNQVNRLTRLISELLDISKIESGKLEMDKKPFELNTLVNDIVSEIRFTNPRQKINIEHRHEFQVNGDRDRIGQILINLLTNAVKYSPGTEKIDVEVGKGNGDTVAVKVRDYGIGIPKDQQERVFERFYRAGAEKQNTYPGFGIGLFIAREIALRHNGEILVDSEPSKGSVFTLQLPVSN